MKKGKKGKRIKRDRIELSGVVLEAHRSAKFTVEAICAVDGDVDITEENKITIICTLCGKMKEHYIKVVPGDKVKVEVSPYDTTKGRITHRMR
ncbi:MAG TPA: translation initiation factor IF-1 [Candidatus Glassbacteria bacterium]|nr:translation initiation factor IF-1 [Candidatus Glassbacteria bacterium]